MARCKRGGLHGFGGPVMGIEEVQLGVGRGRLPMGHGWEGPATKGGGGWRLWDRGMEKPSSIPYWKV
jgi:hypothetical protein